MYHSAAFVCDTWNLGGGFVGKKGVHPSKGPQSLEAQGTSSLEGVWSSRLPQGRDEHVEGGGRGARGAQRRPRRGSRSFRETGCGLATGELARRGWRAVRSETWKGSCHMGPVGQGKTKGSIPSTQCAVRSAQIYGEPTACWALI